MSLLDIFVSGLVDWIDHRSFLSWICFFVFFLNFKCSGRGFELWLLWSSILLKVLEFMVLGLKGCCIIWSMRNEKLGWFCSCHHLLYLIGNRFYFSPNMFMDVRYDRMSNLSQSAYTSLTTRVHSIWFLLAKVTFFVLCWMEYIEAASCWMLRSWKKIGVLFFLFVDQLSGV